MNKPFRQIVSRLPFGPLWLIGLALTANALIVLWICWQPASADAGNVVMAAPHGASRVQPIRTSQELQVVPTQLSATRWGVVLVDTRHDVLAVYRFVGSSSRIQLMASRNFRYDLQLKDFNNSAPTPGQVKAMVAAGKALKHP